jgi:hypothetical protein
MMADLSLHHPALFQQRRGLLNLGVRKRARACGGADHCATNNRTDDRADRASDDRARHSSGNRTGRSTPLVR